MIGISPKALALGAAIGLTATAAMAHGYRSGALSIQHPWSRETAVGQAVGGGFLTPTAALAKTVSFPAPRLLPPKFSFTP